ncbi:hypothetical protein DAEQUDRAFT_241238 [Daedalea quercina L-15889]|uniref:Uncharacterized protein n=1 Tax=Daedalea quercina L-15889 TaxID=1314783 RepID=A0A165QQW5_9APHY|nr:hypothetical protein DAEQUDRAFT_241238 [Daedalea quercina L-15889]
MPSSSRHTRTVSPPLTTASYSNATTMGQQKLNVVTRLAIEGKSKKGWDGASIKMYLKISLPLDTVNSGASIPLFAEENLKVLDAQVHPLDSNSVPYNFSSTDAPLLHKAARALNLAARLPTSYLSLTGSASSSSTSVPPLDAKYTGCILVSGYHISYIAPREFPRKEHDSRTRRNANVMHFMAAVDLWVPFQSKPPFAPYLLSLPVPRCLSNHIRLRISPPGQSTASSYASLSSADEDGGAWELTSDPSVTRGQSARLSRSHSYNNFADDESSDASSMTSFSEGCGLQGSFPSTDRIRVRWAYPAKAGQIPETADGRRRAGIREVKGDMLCTVLGRHKGKARDANSDGLLVKVDYTATCNGVWFPGVATLLGMDLCLEADDCDVTWAPNNEPKWTVTGGAGFTGFAVGGPPQPASRQSVSRQSSAEYPPSIYVLPSSPNGKLVNGNSHIPIRSNSNSSTASTNSTSLLRAPLPAQNVADYSFESSPVSTPSGTVSSLPSLSAPSSPERARRRRSSSRRRDHGGTDTEIDDTHDDVRPPRAPITVHLNMNELSPPPKNVFTFSVSGTVLICPRRSLMAPDSRRSSPASSEDDHNDEPISLPVFRIFSTDQETTSTIIRNEAHQTSVHVFARSKKRDTNVRKAVLMKGNQVSCGSEGARIVLSRISASELRGRRPGEDSSDASYDRTGLSLGLRSTASASKLRDVSMMSTAKLQPLRDGPLMIPFVNAKITSLLGDGRTFKNGYAVEITLPAPSDADSEWLEFGLALPSRVSAPKAEDAPANNEAGNVPPQVEIASASVEGVPVRCQTSAAVKPQAGLIGLGLPFEEMSGKEWISWVSVHVGHIGGGNVRIIYLVKGKEGITKDEKGEKRRHLIAAFDVLLPSFSLPIGTLQVDIQVQEGFKLSSVNTNLVHQQATPHGLRLLHYALAEFHYPQLSVRVSPIVLEPETTPPTSNVLRLTLKAAGVFVVFAIILSLAMALQRTTTELHVLRQAAIRDAVLSSPGGIVLTETVTATTALPSDDPKIWWFNQGVPQSSVPAPLASDASDASESGPFSDSEDRAFLESSIYSPSPTSTIHAIQTDPLQTATTPTAVNESFSLIPAHYFSSWQQLLQSKIIDAQVAQSARDAANAVIGGMDVVWQLLRKIIHYPLDPP